MRSRSLLLSVLLLASCTPTQSPVVVVPRECMEAPAPVVLPPVESKKVVTKPALIVLPVVRGDVSRWKITNQSTEPWRLDLEQLQQHWHRDCRSPLQQIDKDGKARCMPIRAEMNVPAYSTLAPGATAELVFSLQFDSRGPEPILPAGRYRLVIKTTNPTDQKPGAMVQVNFRLEGLDEEEATSLAQRVAFATEHGCVQESDAGQRALAWTAPESIALAALDMPGVPWMQARYGRYVATLPEGLEKLRNALRKTPQDRMVAVNALLWARTQPPMEIREEALNALPSALHVTKYDPILVQSVASSDFRASIIEAVAWRVEHNDEEELNAWESGLACIRPQMGGELAFADLIHAFRNRANKAKPDLAIALRNRANTLEKQLKERRDELEKALQIAQAGRPPFRGPNASSGGNGCGYGTRGIRPDAVCAGTQIEVTDPALRFLSVPMKLHLE